MQKLGVVNSPSYCCGDAADVLENHTEGVHIINFEEIAYHQNEVLYIIIAKAFYAHKRCDEIQGRLTALDDIHRTSYGDDMPLLSQWIKK